MNVPPGDWLDQLVSRSIAGPFPRVVLVLFLAFGVWALMLTPREEEPQIVVPVVDVHVTAPGLSSRQVERQVTTPLEKLLAQVRGVENIYSISRSGGAIVTIRFFVGEDRESALFNTYNKLYSNTDSIPPVVDNWVVKPVEIDDVPIVMIGLWSDDPQRVDDFHLRRMAEEITVQLQALPDTNLVSIVGGRSRKIQVLLDPASLAARHTAPLDIARALQGTNHQESLGSLNFSNESLVLEAGEFLSDVRGLGDTVINVIDGNPVYLKEVARILDGPAVPENYSNLSLGPAHEFTDRFPDNYPLVTIAVSKQRGANAVWVAEDVHELMERVAEDLLPPQVHTEILRDYGQTANEKVNDLTTSLIIAVATVVAFIGIFLGWRPALVVGVAIPLCYGAALAINMASGYSMNRVTLFALILSLGLLVDDPITGIDNIDRLHREANLSPLDTIVRAMAEIRTPLFMSTITIILVFAPLAFITGMMGPYMAPMALNVPVTVALSTFIALFVTPWLAHRLFLSRADGSRRKDEPEEHARSWYDKIISPLISSRRASAWFLVAVAALFVAAVSLPLLRLVPLKLLPFDNRNELQVVVDMPEGTTLEATLAVTRKIQAQILLVPEVKSVAAYVGSASPVDFNGMIRQYYLREGAHLADLRITLVDKQSRSQQSHGILLRLRPILAEVQRQFPGSHIHPVEVPPGPPVISTLVAEVYGTATTPYAELRSAARLILDRLRIEPGVVDGDIVMETESRRLRFVPNSTKAALSGISNRDISATLGLANAGMTATYMQIPEEANPLPVEIRLPGGLRSNPDELLLVSIKGAPGVIQERVQQSLDSAPRPLVPIAELGTYLELPVDQDIYHKDLRPVVYVVAETAGVPPAEVVADVNADEGGAGRSPLLRTYLTPGAGSPWSMPPGTEVVWTGEGELRITLRVFRDMGIAFLFALIAIFFVLRFQTASTALSLIIMLAIPLTVVGLMPGFWILNSIGEREVAGFADPVLFTATAMIGMIALAGIVVRNSLILVEFINNARSRGKCIREALILAGTVRMRPILLTAGTTLLGNIVITLDPVFSGLAWAIIFGIVASTGFTLLVIPCVYYLTFSDASKSSNVAPDGPEVKS